MKTKNPYKFLKRPYRGKLKRVQLKRTKGWRLPPNTVVVARPSQWGNPFPIKEGWEYGKTKLSPRENAVAKFSLKLFVMRKIMPLVWEKYIAPLRGKNLACWCPLDEPCHADLLMRDAADEGVLFP